LSKVLSLREAIDSANGIAGAVVWVPSWNFILTRDRVTFGGTSTTDTSMAYGDLDITKSMTVNGGGGGTNVKWRVGISDAVFELIGDFNDSGSVTNPDDRYVTGSDYLVWQQTLGSMSDLRADANDDYIVDGADDDLWAMYFNNTLMLTNFTYI
jgi:hypothetical protein